MAEDPNDDKRPNPNEDGADGSPDGDPSGDSGESFKPSDVNLPDPGRQGLNNAPRNGNRPPSRGGINDPTRRRNTSPIFGSRSRQGMAGDPHFSNPNRGSKSVSGGSAGIPAFSGGGGGSGMGRSGGINDPRSKQKRSSRPLPPGAIGEGGTDREGKSTSGFRDPFSGLKTGSQPSNKKVNKPTTESEEGGVNRKGSEERKGDNKEHDVGRKNFAQRQKAKFRHPLEYYGKKKAAEALKERVREGVARQAGKRVGGQIGRQAGQAGAKAVAGTGAKAAVGTGTKVGTGAAIEGGLEAAGAAAAPETLGLSFIVATLLTIAINLGMEDAVESLFEIKKGNLAQAKYLAVRAAAKVGIFIVLLFVLVLLPNPITFFPALFVLFMLNIYALVGVFVDYAILQGTVWWERLIIVILDCAVVLVGATLALVLFIGVCSQINSGFQGYILSWVGSGASTAGKVVEVITGTQQNVLSTAGETLLGAQEACEKLKSAMNAVFGDINPNGVPPIIDPGPGSGKCTYAQGANGLQCSAGCDRGDVVKCGSQYDPFVAEAAAAYQVEPNIIRSIIQQESRWVNGQVSSAGAVGLMQILPTTWTSIGCSGDYMDPRSNILCGTKYIKTIMTQLSRRDGAGVGSNLRYISAAYNAGPGTIGRSGQPGSGPFAPSRSCAGQFQWECAFANPGHTACTTNGWAETRNYAVSVQRYYTNYTAGACTR